MVAARQKVLCDFHDRTSFRSIQFGLLDKLYIHLVSTMCSVLPTRGLRRDWTCSFRVVVSPHDGVLSCNNSVLILSSSKVTLRSFVHGNL